MDKRHMQLLMIILVVSLVGGYGCARKTPKEVIAKGIEYAKMGKLDSALSEFSDAIAMKPNDAEGYNRRAGVYFAQHKIEQGMADLNKAIEVNPDYAIAYRNRAGRYFMQREYGKAWADVHKAESLGDIWVSGAFLEELKKASGREK